MSKASIISVVDDDAFVRDATEFLLDSLGFKVLTFASAEQFLRSGRVHDTSCLIADVQMPGLTGPELHRILIEKGYQTPVIFITAFPEENLRGQALKDGAVAFLAKPYDEGDLINSVRAALQIPPGKILR